SYIRKQQRHKFQRILSRVGRISSFRTLPHEEVEELASAFFSCDYPQGVWLYRKGDPSERLYIIDTGMVHLLDPKRGTQPFQQLPQNAAFGRLGFFTGPRRAAAAVTAADTRLWVLPRQAFDQLLQTSPQLATAMEEFLQDDEIRTYLQERQGMSA